MSLSLEEQACNFQTSLHIKRVGQLIHVVVKNMLDRADHHDDSKLQSPEVELFTKYTPLLAACTYGSEEYNQYKKEMSVALEHHYANNRHHPEHHKDGVNDMTLLDLIEMFVDWKAASERHNNGNIRKSIEINGKRFNMSPQLINIFENTAKELF